MSMTDESHARDETVAGVVGLGQVGLPLAVEFARAGHDVVGVDIDEERVATLAAGESYVRDVSDEGVAVATERGFTATTRYDALADAAFVSVCVPTPLQKTGKPDVSYVEAAAEQLADVLSSGCTVILESTVYPGGTDEVLVETFERRGHSVGDDLHVAFSPERINPGDDRYHLTTIPKVLGGVTPACGDRAQAFYEEVFDTIHRVDSTVEAELTKILENSFRSVNIALVNELAQVAERLDADIWNVIAAADTKPFGFLTFYPGPGLGGHCIPVDPLYLSWKASQHGYQTDLIDTANQINRRMPEFVVYRIIDLLSERNVDAAGAHVHLLGVAYKPDVSDIRESPALDIISLLEQRGVDVSYTDPHVESVEVEGTTYESHEPTPDRLASNDVVVVVTDHAEFDVDHLVEHSPLLFDTRNMTDGYDDPTVVRL